MSIKYQQMKKKKFKLKKDAEAWAREQKAKVNPINKVKIEINFLQGEGQFNYEALILRKA